MTDTTTTTTTIELPETFEVIIDGDSYKIETAKWQPDFILAQIEQGIKIRLQRAGSGQGNKATARKQVAASLNEGTLKAKSDPLAKAAKAIAGLTPEQLAELMDKLGK